jgi:hydrogenase maturation protein HypF
VSRVQVRVDGTVQGVGFRPHVYRLAHQMALGGFVCNDTRGVLLEVEGSPPTIDEFLARLTAQAPPLARIEGLHRRDVAPRGEHRFQIRESQARGEASAPVSPDVATCADCLAELADPADRRYRYPFTNCTNCGPRFTIVLGVPYDRRLTTMAQFVMCARCQAEYEDPLDRRFHAQPNACPECGPTLSWRGSGGRDRAAGELALSAAVAALARGLIVAVKGIGGVHLACRADRQATVRRLRERKQREEKPLALMAPDLAAARRLVELGDAEAEALSTPARPIVLAARRAPAAVADAVAPGARELGVMLPYSPLHHLLLGDLCRRDPSAGAALVMTSANVSDEPMVHSDDEALRRLADIADGFLLHDRPIHTRVDDSVVRAGIFLRRSRGQAPQALGLDTGAAPPLLACGAELKSTFCLAKGGRAWVSHHIGDLKNYETLRAFEDGVQQMQRLFAVSPELVVHDQHPDYLSTRYALARAGVQTVGVQHHHAHLAACLAEHGHAGPALGVIYDGAGFGPDGTVWGGELLLGGLAGYERVGHLWPVALPGGDRAAREPWRMACAWLQVALGEQPALPPALRGAVGSERWVAVAALARQGPNAPLSSSAGRLFDAVAALCGCRPRVTFEGQAAMQLEALADPLERAAHPWGEGLDGREAVRAVADDLAAGVSPALVAARFHNGLARATADACARAAEQAGVDTVVLSGGCFQNRLLLERTRAALAPLRCLVPRHLPPNDGGVAFGQAAVAAWSYGQSERESAATPAWSSTA